MEVSASLLLSTMKQGDNGQRVKSRKLDQLVNLITLRFLDFGVPARRQQWLWDGPECIEVAKN